MGDDISVVSKKKVFKSFNDKLDDDMDEFDSLTEDEIKERNTALLMRLRKSIIILRMITVLTTNRIKRSCQFNKYYSPPNTRCTITTRLAIYYGSYGIDYLCKPLKHKQMIELSNEMYITKDVYRALVDYGNILVVDLLRKAINLEEKEDDDGEKYYTIREEFETLAFQEGSVTESLF